MERQRRTGRFRLEHWQKIRLILTLTPSTDATLSKHAAIQAFANEQGVEFFLED